MAITSDIRFEKTLNGQYQSWQISMDSITISEIESELEQGAHALIINTFRGKVPLSEMVESTSASVKIMERTSKPVDILAVMERGSSLAMSIADIKKTSAIMDFAVHPQRGATIAVMYEKTVTKFFLTLANQMLPNANFVLANSMEEAENMLQKYRKVRV